MGWKLASTALGLAALAVAVPSAAPRADKLYPLGSKVEAAWAEYLKVTEYRIDHELAATSGFLALDFSPRRDADRQAALGEEIPIAEMASVWQNGTTVTVPDHWVHHWRGAVLLKGVKLDQVFARLEREVPGVGQPGVLKAAVLKDNWPTLHTYIQVQRQGSFLISYNYVYNTEHDVEFARRSPGKGTSRTIATKIAELDQPGSPQERELQPREESRFLLRWNSYWRYEEIGAGVIAECESVTLSRDFASILSLVGAHRIASGAAQDAMLQALVNLRTFFRTPPSSLPAR